MGEAVSGYRAQADCTSHWHSRADMAMQSTCAGISTRVRHMPQMKCEEHGKERSMLGHTYAHVKDMTERRHA
jgi:hypothetical protein